MGSARIEELLRKSDVFGGMDDPLREHLLESFVVIDVADGVDIMTVGDEGDALYLVLEGRYRVYLPGDEELNLHEGEVGEIFGEIGLLTREPRSASVKALGAMTLARLPRACFEMLDDDFPDAFEHVRLAIIKKLRHARVEQLLRASGLFCDVDEETLTDIESRLVPRTLESGEQLMARGEPGDAMYLLLHGRLSVSMEQADGTRVRLAEIRRGESVGEIALVTGRPRAADVFAIRDSEVMKLSRTAFDELLLLRPHFVVHDLAGGVVARLVDQIRSPKSHERGLSTLAILPLHEGVDLDGFCARLDAAFEPLGRTRRLNRARVDDVFGPPSIVDSGPDDAGREILSGWLNGQEAKEDHLLLQGEFGMTSWTQACLRQADQILWVAESDAFGRSPAFHDAADALAHRAEPLPESLALLHRGQQVSGTSAWLSHHPWQRHHHVRPGKQGDVERIARFLTDRAVGLVLSGGAARGFSHAGVVRAMGESGVPIDCVAGVSMGAIMAALCAMERDPDDMIRTTLQMTRSVMDHTLPMVSVVKGRRFIDRLDAVLGERLVEDLCLPSFYLSANLTQARVEMHQRGSLALAVTASNAPPGLGPPVVQDGDLLVDGFVMNNLPVDLMRGVVHGGPIVAVDVMPATDLPDNADFGRRGLSGWRVLWRRVNPFLKTMTLPSIAEIIMRSHEINSVARQRELKDQTPYYLQPPVGGFDMFNYDEGRRIADSAYAAVVDDVRGWAAELKGTSRRTL